LVSGADSRAKQEEGDQGAEKRRERHSGSVPQEMLSRKEG
jgi:hypothetical protein